MSKIIQVRNVPDQVHHRLTVRAAEQRKSLSDLVLGELEEIASRPTMSEMLERLEGREPVKLDRPISEVIDKVRKERDRGIVSSVATGAERLAGD